MVQIQDYSYIFVLTYGRSGSTILMRLLNLPNTVEIRGENSNALFHLFQAVSNVQKSKKRFGNSSRDTSDPWFGADKISGSAFETDCLNSFVANVLNPSGNVKTTGFKEIAHLPNRMNDDEFNAYIAFILAKFPKVQIVFNTRNPQQVASSGWFKDMPQDYVFDQVTMANERFNITAKQHARCRVIDYSDVVENGAALKKLFNWLNIEFDRKVTAEILSVPLTHMKNQGVLYKIYKMAPSPLQNTLAKLRSKILR